MTIQQLIDMAKQGELKNLAVANDTNAILGFLNLGLIELYKRFPIDLNEVVITLGEDGDVDNPYTLISDELYEMPSDFMWLTSAYGEAPEYSNETVVDLPVNEEDDPLSVNMVSWNTLQIPLTTDGAYVGVIYTASPAVYTDTDLAETLPIPPQMVEALLHYIGYRAHNAVTGEISSENTTHYTRFEASCSRIEQKGMITVDDISMDSRVSDRGFV